MSVVLEIEYGGTIVATVPITITERGHYVKAIISAASSMTQNAHAWLASDPGDVGVGSANVNSEIDQTLRIILRADSALELLDDDFVQLRTAIVLWLYSDSTGAGAGTGILISFAEIEVPRTGLFVAEAEFEVAEPLRLIVTHAEFEVVQTGLLVAHTELQVPVTSLFVAFAELQVPTNDFVAQEGGGGRIEQEGGGGHIKTED